MGVVEAMGVVIGSSAVGLLLRIAKQLGHIDAKLKIMCQRVSDHEDRLRRLEKP